MARVDILTHKEPIRSSVHGAVDATYFVFEQNGETYLQIDTYGSPTRETPAKISQSIQLGTQGLAALRAILNAIGD